MQSIDEINRVLAFRALKKSSIRKRILEYLMEIDPRWSYVSEIAYNIRSTPTNVIGAIKGMGDRYSERDSLLCLNLVEKTENGNNIKLYKISELGKEIVKELRNGKMLS